MGTGALGCPVEQSLTALAALSFVVRDLEFEALTHSALKLARRRGRPRPPGLEEIE
jgi:hypothetical protein